MKKALFNQMRQARASKGLYGVHGLMHGMLLLQAQTAALAPSS